MSNEHTPTPWQIGFSDGSGADEDGWCIVSADETAVVFSAESFGTHYGIQKKANAAFIVRAVNSHDALVAALEWALLRIGPEPRLIRGQNDAYCNAYAAAKAALANATATQF